jgi:hypothetical protein
LRLPAIYRRCLLPSSRSWRIHVITKHEINRRFA